MSEVDMKVVEEKVAKGEALTAAEVKAVMSVPPEGESNQLAPEDDIKDEDFHEGDPDKEAADKAAADKAAADKLAADKAAKEKDGKVETTDEFIKRYNEQSAKPEGQEDFTGWSEAEKGYFRQMKTERKRAQKAEDDLAVLQRQDLKRKKDEADAKAAKETEDEEAKIFEGRNPEDPLTIKDLQAMMKLNKKRTIKDTDSAPAGLIDLNNPIIKASFKYQDDVARKDLGDDYDETVECAVEIINDNPSYLDQIGKALVRGENVAKLTYELIKKDPEYLKALPVARARLIAAGKKVSDGKTKEEVKPKDEATKAAALKAQEKLEENQNKKKTSAHVSDAGAETGALFGDYTADQLLKMSDQEYRKVPKKTREAFMKAMG